MNRTWLLVLALLLLVAGSSPISPQGQSQYPLADKLADKVIQKYQTSSCEQLAAKKREQPPPQEAAMMQRVVTLLRQDPQLRNHFINKVAPPIANKLFDCGFIP
jgi:hypothetical protein